MHTTGGCLVEVCGAAKYPMDHRTANHPSFRTAKVAEIDWRVVQHCMHKLVVAHSKFAPMRT